MALWQKVEAHGNPRPFYQDLISHYLKDRFFHDPSHLSFMLKAFDQIKHLLSDPDAVEMAIFLHDAICQPLAPNNEELTTVYARVFLKRASVNNDFIESVCRKIMATKHPSFPDEFDEQMMVDLDLLIFAAEPKVFDQATTDVWQEYRGKISWKAFRAGRADFLERYLKQPTVFLTPVMRRDYETKAQENLARAVKRLRK